MPWIEAINIILEEGGGDQALSCVMRHSPITHIDAISAIEVLTSMKPTQQMKKIQI